LKLERIKDYLLLEEEFVQNQERMKPQEEKNQVAFPVFDFFFFSFFLLFYLKITDLSYISNLDIDNIYPPFTPHFFLLKKHKLKRRNVHELMI